MMNTKQNTKQDKLPNMFKVFNVEIKNLCVSLCVLRESLCNKAGEGHYQLSIINYQLTPPPKLL
jgi:hypothetical protein